MQRRLILAGLFCAVMVVGVFLTRDRWLSRFAPRASQAKADEPTRTPIEDAKVLKLSAEVQKNLGLIVKPIKPQAYWRTIQVPGEVVDRPGRSDRGVTAPACGEHPSASTGLAHARVQPGTD